MPEGPPRAPPAARGLFGGDRLRAFSNWRPLSRSWGPGPGCPLASLARNYPHTSTIMRPGGGGRGGKGKEGDGGGGRERAKAMRGEPSGQSGTYVTHKGTEPGTGTHNRNRAEPTARALLKLPLSGMPIPEIKVFEGPGLAAERGVTRAHCKFKFPQAALPLQVLPA